MEAETEERERVEVFVAGSWGVQRFTPDTKGGHWALLTNEMKEHSKLYCLAVIRGRTSAGAASRLIDPKGYVEQTFKGGDDAAAT